MLTADEPGRLDRQLAMPSCYQRGISAQQCLRSTVFPQKSRRGGDAGTVITYCALSDRSQVAICTREEAPSFARTCSTCASTVLLESPTRSASSGLNTPSAPSAAISRSLLATCPAAAGPAAAAPLT